MSSFSSSSSSFPSSEDAQNHHPPSEEKEFAFDGDDGNVLDAILHRVDFIWERTRAKVEDVYHHPELLVLVLFSLVLAHFIAGRIFFNKGKERKIGSKNSKKRDSIVLCGQDGAGSTSAYLLLKNKSLGLGTVTSSIENESEVEICVSSSDHEYHGLCDVVRNSSSIVPLSYPLLYAQQDYPSVQSKQNS